MDRGERVRAQRVAQRGELRDRVTLEAQNRHVVSVVLLGPRRPGERESIRARVDQ